ncbi:Uncharacterised protein [Bacteroides xylanisolvens]|nr:Uncharacterised protein [Bacteroides xylanisolvens]
MSVQLFQKVDIGLGQYGAIDKPKNEIAMVQLLSSNLFIGTSRIIFSIWFGITRRIKKRNMCIGLQRRGNKHSLDQLPQ